MKNKTHTQKHPKKANENEEKIEIVKWQKQNYEKKSTNVWEMGTIFA